MAGLDGKGKAEATTFPTFPTFPPPPSASAPTGLEREDELASSNPERDPHSPFYSRFDESPEESANFLSKLTFSWLDSLIWFGHKQPILAKDAYPLPPDIRANKICEQTFLKEWDKELASAKPSLTKAVWRSVRTTWLKGSLCRFGGDFSQVISPILLQKLIAFLTALYTYYFVGPPYPGAPAPSSAVGFGYACGILALQLWNSLCINHFWSFSQKTGLKVRTSLTAAVFQKCLRLSQAARTQFSAGRAVQTLSVDTSRMDRTLAEAQSLWASPLLVLEIMVVLIVNLGAPAALVGLAILLVMIPMSGTLMKKTMALRKQANKMTDARVKVTGEIVNGIRVLKFQGWERAMLAHLAELRQKELEILRKASMVRAFVMSIYVLQPVLAGMGMFATFAALGGTMNAAVILGSLAYMNVLRFPLMSLPTSISTVGDAMVSIKRLQGLLLADELDKEPPNDLDLPTEAKPELVVKVDPSTPPAPESPAPVGSPAIIVQKATFVWQNPEEAVPVLATAASKKGKVDPGNLTFTANNVNNITMLATFGPRRGLFGRKSQQANPVADVLALEAASAKTSVPATPNNELETDKFSSLRGINLTIPRGKLVCIVGPVGSGKSSLLMALAGEMKQVGGHLSFPGLPLDPNSDIKVPVVAYCAQIAWIMNATVRENITQGAVTPYDEQRYWETIRVCALERDLEVLTNGDMTDIGERGINLSGGQKQRISLARAVYSQQELLFLDDPLSAVDAHVGKHILNEAILGVLKGKTIVMATHQLHVLPFADHVVCLDRGEIVEQGAYEELLSKDGYLSKMVREYSASAEDLDDEILDESEEEEIVPLSSGERRRSVVPPEVMARRNSTRPDPQETEVFAEVENAEDIEEGGIPSAHALGVVDYDESDTTTAGQAESSTVADTVVARSDIKKRRASDRRASAAVAPTQQAAADGNVDAAQLNSTNMKTYTKGARHNLEEERATGSIPFSVYAAYVQNGGGWIIWITIILTMILSQVAGIGINLWLTAWTQNKFPSYGIGQYLGVYFALGASMALLLFFCGILFAYGGMLASRGIHEKAITRLIRAPISFFDRTPAGRILNRFSRDVDAVDTQLIEFFRLFMLMFSIVLTTLVLIATLLPIFLAVCLPLMIGYFFLSRVARNSARELKRLDSNSRSPLYANFSETLSGLSTVRSYHLQKSFIKQNQTRLDFNNRFQWLTIQISRWLGLRIELVSAFLVFATAMFAVSGVAGGASPAVLGLGITYALGVTGTLNGLMRNLTEMELQMNGVERLQYYIDSLPAEAAEVTEYHPTAGWPSQGQIEFRNLEMRYSPDLPLVLKGLNLVVKPGERIGIVGRTGAGKSSLTMALFRLVEPCGGQILIDGVDISKLGLFELRHNLSVIPQDPVVFSGTLRYNLDPFNERTDEEILQVLESCGDIKTLVQAHKQGLNMPVAENGENFSVGQRQLICLARAILKQSKILCLDEASASLDYDSDALIQQIIQEHPSFQDKTIITIAHRLQTIINYHRIVVLSHGEIVELGTPAELVQIKDGHFRKLVDETGDSAEALIKMALSSKTTALAGDNVQE